MKKLLLLFCLLNHFLLFSQSPDSSPRNKIAAGKTPTEFNFTLNGPKKVSAGVYTADGILVRTLFSNKSYPAGRHAAVWDGMDDAGVSLPYGSYKLKWIESNVTAVWEGVLGNTSNEQTGSTQHHSHEVIQDMVIVGNTAYYCVNYNETGSSTFKFSTNNPQSRSVVLGKGAEVKHLCTDGARIYYAARDPFNRYKSFVFALETSDNSEVSFDNGSTYQAVHGRKYQSAVGVFNTTPATGAGKNPQAGNSESMRSEISGIAVQTKGNYLFVARSAVNEIHVLNKNTGALVQTITSITSPRRMFCDGSNNVWIISEKNVYRHRVNEDGNLSEATLTLSGLAEPLSVTVNKNTVVVNDGGLSQQVKGFDRTSGNRLWTMGEEGGYITNGAVVNNNKFFLTSRHETIRTFTAFQADGSFWVGDGGNNRIQHYAADRRFVDRVMYIIKNYSCRVDPNNTTRVFANYLEFEVDYSKPLQQSWTLVKNWGASFNTSNEGPYSRLLSLATLPNRRTYAVAFTKQGWELIELTPENSVRFTGVTWPNSSKTFYQQLYPDGSLRRITKHQPGVPTEWYQKDLTGFDGSNNPMWGSEVLKASGPLQTSLTPGFHGNIMYLQAGERTTNGKYVVLDYRGIGEGYHLGLVQERKNSWSALTATATHKGYRGDYPEDGAFDIGNGVKHAGNYAKAFGNIIVWGYNGEFWKGSQTNKYTLVHENGLMIGLFGWAGNDEHDIGNAGNTFSWNIVHNPTDKTGAYLYHNDESQHGGVHRWKISGLNTIDENEVNIEYNAPVVMKPLPYTNLMSNLPYRSGRYSTNNGNGWTFPSLQKNVVVGTSWYTYDKKDVDLFMRKQVKSGTDIIERDFSSEVATDINLWLITGFVSYAENNENNGNDALYWDLLDEKDNVIVRVYIEVTNYPNVAMKANTVTVLKGTNTSTRLITHRFQPVEIKYNEGRLSFKYGNQYNIIPSVYTVGANVKRPSKLRFTFTSCPNKRAIDIHKFRLYKNRLN